MRSKLAAMVAALAVAAGCSTPSPRGEAAKPEVGSIAPVRLKDRVVDLDAHLRGFPYRLVRLGAVDARAGRLFYVRTGTRETLMMTSLDASGPVNFDAGQVLSAMDVSRRNLWGMFVNPQTGRPIFRGDERNDEVTNFYELDPATDTERRLTDVAYVFAYRLSEDGRRLAFTSRAGKAEMTQGELRVLDLSTGQVRVIFADTPDRKLTWGRLSWQPGDRGLLVPFIAGASRTRRNLLYVPLSAGAGPRVVTDLSVKRSALQPLDRWLGDADFLYTSDEADFTGVYRGGLSGQHRLVTAAGENVKDAAVIDEGARRRLVVTTGNPLRTEVKLLDLETGAVLSSERADEVTYILDAHHDRAFLRAESLTVPFRVSELRVRDGRLVTTERAAYPRALLGKIVRCEPEKVSFETFDKLAAPGERGLHAYLLTPKAPRADRRALVLAFYGGFNDYAATFQILCDAGYHVLSPALRGSAQFGERFANIGNGDWGGAETLDGFAAGRFLAARLGLPPHRVGIFGGSRGGYDVLRALTFPGEVNGIEERFRFGFGVANYGISDVVRAAEGGNISQWYAMLTGGDPRLDPAKWRDRSPLTHAHRLSVPLLLTHGTNDHRVPVVESRSMYAAAKALGKDVTYVEFPNEGHGYKNPTNVATYYRTLLEFLDRLP